MKIKIIKEYYINENNLKYINNDIYNIYYLNNPNNQNDPSKTLKEFNNKFVVFNKVHKINLNIIKNEIIVKDIEDELKYENLIIKNFNYDYYFSNIKNIKNNFKTIFQYLNPFYDYDLKKIKDHDELQTCITNKDIILIVLKLK